MLFQQNWFQETTLRANATDPYISHLQHSFFSTVTSCWNLRTKPIPRLLPTFLNTGPLPARGIKATLKRVNIWWSKTQKQMLRSEPHAQSLKTWLCKNIVGFHECAWCTAKTKHVAQWVFFKLYCNSWDTVSSWLSVRLSISSLSLEAENMTGQGSLDWRPFLGEDDSHT